jgi:glycosyltransferase involved in cell wall biosynthesis
MVESAGPQASVVIPTYNRAGLLRRTLDSLVAQDCPATDFEVIVVDDGSTDPTRAVVEQFSGRLDVKYLFQPDEGFRVAAARNLGLAHASGRVCAFIDSGVLAHSGWLRAHLHDHDTFGACAVVGYVYCFNHDNEDAEQMLRELDFGDPDGVVATLARQGRWCDVREAFYARYGDAIEDLPAPWQVFWTCNVSVGTGQLRAVGGFDENFRSWGGEDLELGYRLHRSGVKFVLNRDAIAIHHPHDKSDGHNNVSLATNFRYIAEKHDTPITRLLVDPSLKRFDLNEVVLRRGLPACDEYMAAASHGAAQSSGGRSSVS